jgi:hypothetical protein
MSGPFLVLRPDQRMQAGHLGHQRVSVASARVRGSASHRNLCRLSVCTGGCSPECLHSIDAAELGAQRRRRVLGSLAQVVNSTAELRYAGFGTGHGVSRAPELDVATARMVVSAAVTKGKAAAQRSRSEPPWNGARCRFQAWEGCRWPVQTVELSRASGFSEPAPTWGSPRLSAQSPNPSRRRSSQRWVANSPPK